MKVDFAAYYQDTGMVFCTPEGRPIDPHNWARLKKKIAEEAKVPDFRIHDMRHFFCTQLIKRGVNVKAVQGMLGHSTAAMTLNASGGSYLDAAQAVAAKTAHYAATGTARGFLDSERDAAAGKNKSA